jgi:hypothetical protein
MNLTCAQLNALRYADCFHRISQIRIYNDGNPTAQPRVTDVHVTGGCGGIADGYFSVLPTAATNCTYDVSASVNWGTRDDGNLNVPANFTVKANGVNLTQPSGSPSGVWSSSGGALTLSTAGPNTISIALSWTDENTGHHWPTAGDQCKNGNNNPCKYSGTEAAHRAFLGTKATSGAVGLVRSSGNTFTGNPSQPSPPFDNSAGNTTQQIFPTVGTVSVL